MDRDVTDQATLKELIEEKFEGVYTRLDGIDGQIGGLTDQVKTTNGRVREHDRAIANIGPRLEATERDLKRSVLIKELSGENRGITQRDVLIVLGTIASFYGALKFLEWFSHLKAVS